MKHLFKIVTVATIAALSIGCASVLAKGDQNKAEKKIRSEQTTVEKNTARSIKGDKPELTEEEKAARAEKMKAKLAEKLADGKLTQEEYDAELARIESGDFKPDRKGGKGHSMHKPHDKAVNKETAE